MTPLAPFRLSLRLSGLLAVCARTLLDRRLRVSTPQNAHYRATRSLAVSSWLCRSHGLALTINGQVPSVPSIIVANHLSYADTLVLPGAIAAACIAKAEVGRWPLLGPVVARLGTIFVERDNAFSGAVALRKAMRLLQLGVSVIVFPEGTTTSGDQVLPFRRGIFGVARRLGVPVIPAALRYADADVCWVGDQTFLPHYLRTVGVRRTIPASVNFGAAMDPTRWPSAAALAEAARDQVRAGLERARPT